MAGHYPQSAIAWNIHGFARIMCKVKADGSLTDCFVDVEVPRGYGFGQATLDVSPNFRMKPKDANGLSVEGATVSIPMRWFLSDVVYTPVFEVGDNDLLVTYMQPGEQPKDPKNPVFPCASPGDRGRRCQGHPFRWDDRPTNDELWQVIAHANVRDRETRLSCSLGDDGKWSECRVSGEATSEEEATMRALAKDMLPEPEARDGVPLKTGRITLYFDWPRLKWISSPAKDHPGGAEPKSTH
jgi:TonB family protein